MYESKKTPGKKFGSAFAGKRYDEAHSEDGLHKLGQEAPEHEEKETPEFEAGEHEGAEEHEGKEHEGEENTQEEEQVAAEHGPAHKVVISHDEQSGRHVVQSHHKDGHSHSRVHANAAHAHKAGKALAGVPADGQPEEKESPYHQGKGQQSASSEEDGFAMPDLA
jgi:hypothetical protein